MGFCASIWDYLLIKHKKNQTSRTCRLHCCDQACCCWSNSRPASQLTSCHLPLQRRSSSLCRRSAKRSLSFNQKLISFWYQERTFGYLHTEQGVVCHLDGQYGTFLLVEKVPDLENSINSRGEEDWKPEKVWKCLWRQGLGGIAREKNFFYLAGLHAPPVRRTGAGFIHIMADDFRSSDQILQVLSPTSKKVKMTTIMMTAMTITTTTMILLMLSLTVKKFFG